MDASCAFDIAINAVFDLPNELIIAYGWFRLLSIRSAKAWLCGILFLLVFGTAARCFSLDSVQVIMLIGYYFVFPFLLARDSRAYKVVVITAVFTVIMVSEVACTTFWVHMTGLPIKEFYSVRAHFDAYVVMRLSSYLCMALLLWALFIVFERLADRGKISGLAYFAGFAASQLALLSAGWLIVELGKVESDLISAGGLLVVLYLLADALLLRAFDRYQKGLLLEHRAEMLQRQLDWCLANYDGIMREVEQVARFRHDFGNHLQAITALVERGHVEEACQHVDAMLDAASSEATFVEAEGEAERGPQAAPLRRSDREARAECGNGSGLERAR